MGFHRLSLALVSNWEGGSERKEGSEEAEGQLHFVLETASDHMGTDS